MSDFHSNSIHKFIAQAKMLGHRDIKVSQMSESTHTAQEAADAIGCKVSEIVKSIIFKVKNTDEPVLILTSGTNHVDDKLLAQELGEKIAKADADFIKLTTGFSIGGIPPFGHTQHITTIMDEDLMQHEQVWAAAGSPYSVFSISPHQLQIISKARVMTVSKSGGSRKATIGD